MSVDQLINVLVMVTLVEMMVATGLGVSVADLRSVARDWPLLARAAAANYVCVPLVTVALLLLFRAQPMVKAGFLILAVCPGAPYGPPLTAVAKGNVPASVGLMVILAGTSAAAAPLLLSFLLPLMSDDQPLTVDAARLVGTLLATQLAPLGLGLAVRRWRPAVADRLRNPANLVGKVLNLLAVGLILVTQYQTLAAIRPAAFAGMLALLVASMAAGRLSGGPADGVRRALTITTALRNVGVGLVIAAGIENGKPAMTAVLAYGLFGVLGSLLLALCWSRPGAAGSTSEGQPAPGGVVPVKKNGQTHRDGPL
jgi:BASS family bile acid:Na+ symporter